MNSLIIALFHAVPITLIGLFMKRPSALNWTATIMCMVAIFSGNPSYLTDDLIVIGVAYVLMMQAITPTKNKLQRREPIFVLQKPTTTPATEENKYVNESRSQKTVAITERTPSHIPPSHAHERKALPTRRSAIVHSVDSRQDKDFKTGDKVKLQAFPDGEIGVVIKVWTDGTCTVKFPNSTHAGMPVERFAIIEDIENERPTREAAKRIRLEKQRTAEIEAQWNETIEREAAEKRLQQKIEEQRRTNQKKLQEITVQFAEFGISCLWHITHRDNIKNILRDGILNHYDAHRANVNCVDISNPDAQRWRECIDPCYGRRIHEYAPLYINARNPMLYVRRDRQDEICLLEVSLSSLTENEYLITDGNAASRDTKFYNSVDRLHSLPWDVLHAGYWADLQDGKRKRCSEVLIFPKVLPQHMGNIHCHSFATMQYLSQCGHVVSLTKCLFF